MEFDGPEIIFIGQGCIAGLCYSNHRIGTLSIERGLARVDIRLIVSELLKTYIGYDVVFFIYLFIVQDFLSSYTSCLRQQL